MDTNTAYLINEHVLAAIEDGPNLLHDIYTREYKDNEMIEVNSLLPAYPDPDILLGYVLRWREVHLQLNREMRIYAWCETPEVEKAILSCTQQLSFLHVTALPTSLKEKKHYAY